jgi:hypothetical protein
VERDSHPDSSMTGRVKAQVVDFAAFGNPGSLESMEED